MKVWVWADVTEEGPSSGTLEVLTKARDLGNDVAAVALGPGAKSAAGPLGEHGARNVFASDDEVYSRHLAQPRTQALATLVEEHQPDLILFPTSYEARDVAGRLQARTGSTLMANATDVLGPDKARTEILGGTKIIDVELVGPAPKLVLIRPQSFAAEPSGGTAEVVDVTTDISDELKVAEVVERHEEEASGPRLEDAKVVVAGGRGLGGPEAFELLDKLAAAIGSAAVGASRAAVDAGWVPYSYQVGQTGKTVKPEVYLCFGISGALQHLVGMKSSKRIVAVTKDADAPILKVADLGVVGDLFQVVPALTEEIEKRRTGS
ncbi:MAG TPA: electron transfer flavoprotein subunit alpha/FixB family protein [Actinomycetota bacterium]|nr:electron transfer flavoprotein subunit alpha/FixB family protein [Actinomycetota bacterium]